MTDVNVREPNADSRAPLSTLRLPELQALAAQLGISGTSKLRKGELVTAITEAQNSSEGKSSKDSQTADTVEASTAVEPATEPAAVEPATEPSAVEPATESAAVEPVAEAPVAVAAVVEMPVAEAPRKRASRRVSAAAAAPANLPAPDPIIVAASRVVSSDHVNRGSAGVNLDLAPVEASAPVEAPVTTARTAAPSRGGAAPARTANRAPSRRVTSAEVSARHAPAGTVADDNDAVAEADAANDAIPAEGAEVAESVVRAPSRRRRASDARTAEPRTAEPRTAEVAETAAVAADPVTPAVDGESDDLPQQRNNRNRRNRGDRTDRQPSDRQQGDRETVEIESAEQATSGNSETPDASEEVTEAVPRNARNVRTTRAERAEIRDNQRAENAARDAAQRGEIQRAENTGREENQREQRGNQRGENQQRENQRNENQRNDGQRNDGRENDRMSQNDLDGDRNGRNRYRDRKRRGPGTGDDFEPEITEDDVLIPVAGILDVLDNYAFVRTSGYLPGNNDVYVSLGQVKKYHLRKGDAVVGSIRQPRDNDSNGRQKYNAIVKIDSINGFPIEQAADRVEFSKLTPLYPQERLRLETESAKLSTRIIDLVSPIGKGQRGLIVSPPKAGKTLVLQAIANAIAKNNPEVHLMVVLVDERPEEVTDM